MENYDLIVIGSGAGMNIAAPAVNMGLKVALIEDGPLGGTCLNRGCIPTKIMIYPADILRATLHASKIGVITDNIKLDFKAIMKRMHEMIDDDVKGMTEGVNADDRIDFYNSIGEFIDEYTLLVDDKKIKGKRIIIASGSRPLIPNIKGLEEIGFWTSRDVFSLEEPPKTLVIVGGGYIAAEFAHFFSAVGTKVTIVGRNPRLLKNEEPEISKLVLEKMREYCTIYVNSEVKSAGKTGSKKFVKGRDNTTGEIITVEADEILIAAGRRSNADWLKPEKTGVKIDRNGWITVNEYLETSKENIWALGDAIGHQLFRHTANAHSEVIWNNVFQREMHNHKHKSNEHKQSIQEHAVPHAVFTYPQVASVGLTQAEAEKNQQYRVFVGKKAYRDTAKGYAIGDEDGFVKIIVDGNTYQILGASIVGSYAAILLQSLVYLMNTQDRTFIPITRAQIIHPALSEVVGWAFGNLRPTSAHQSHRHHS
ncbi:MAG: dihydrolipoyl dehydrogenase [Promethearchaeota archaeon]